MSIRMSLLIFACAAVTAFGAVARGQALGGDPRIDGVLPHVLPGSDPYILADPKTLKLPSARPSTPVRPTPPASTAASSTASAPATGPEAAPASAPTSGPEASPASAPTTGPEATPASVPAAGGDGAAPPPG